MPTAVELTPTAWGDSAVLVSASGGDDERRWAAVLRLTAALAARPPVGTVDLVHAAESVLVVFDCVATDADAVADAVRSAGRGAGRRPRGRRSVVEADFGGAAGPDTASVLESTGLTAEALIDWITGADLVVRAVGGNALPLLQRRSAGGPVVPRLPSPRPVVPAGSIGMAGDRICIYPVAAPGGWRVVGRVREPLLDLAADPIAPYRAGDLIRLRPAPRR